MTAECITKTKHDYTEADLGVLDTNGKPVRHPNYTELEEGKFYLYAMAVKSFLLKPFAKRVSATIQRNAKNAVADQHKILHKNIQKAAATQFGKDHQLGKVKSYADFKSAVPVRDYEELKKYFDQVRDGAKDVLWPGVPKYLAKTSGTTSGVKYIPLTKDSIPNHFGTARNALFNYYAQSGKGDWVDGKMIFLSGSPQLSKTSGILTGRLSGIVNHMVPSWLRGNQLPSYETNCIDDWETKLDRIVEETKEQDMRLISGIPPWVQMYYERLLEKTGAASISELFPNFNMFVYGGVNFEPYREVLEKLVGKSIPTLETYPASEGFIAYQDDTNEKGLLLNTNSGIFFEFILTDEFGKADAVRMSIKEVELGVNYVIVLNSNAGLWGYNIGDTVEFVSLDPYKIIVTGRIKHFISAFGEHVIGKEVEKAMVDACAKHQVEVVEFTVAPQVNPIEGLPYHEWLIEFAKAPQDLESFSQTLDNEMINQNIYYRDLIKGQILRPLKISSLRKNAFRDYMKSQGKLGGQNKVPRLSNDRSIADPLMK